MYNNLFTIGKITIHSYGLMIAIGFVMAVVIGEKLAKIYGLDKDVVFDIGIYGIISGFIGAKLLYVIVEFKSFLKNPIEVIGSEGFVVYGGLIAGILGAVVYCRIKKVSFIQYFNMLIPCVSVAQGFGRIGCFMAGCCYGKETHSCIGVEFPHASLAPSGVKLIPTQLISSAGNFAIAIVLFIFYKKTNKKEYTSALYLLLYGIGRFIIEIFRNDERGSILGISTSQFISIIFIILSVVLFVATKFSKKYKKA